MSGGRRVLRRGAAVLAAGVLALGGAPRLAAQVAPEVMARVQREAWNGVAALERMERNATAAAESPRDTLRARTVAERRARLDGALRGALDTLLLLGAPGDSALGRLVAAYPESPLLERYAARQAARSGREALALDRYDRLMVRGAADATLQIERGETLERLGRTAEAAAGYARALDLDPEAEPPFRALVRVREAGAGLPLLLEQVRRLRIAMPGSRVLAVREVEVLERLGRAAEAQEAARAVRERRP